MTPATLLIAFFLFTLAAVAAVGYVFVMRPARAHAAAAPQIPSPLIAGQRDLPVAQAAVLDMFRLIGDAMPFRESQTANIRNLLGAAGYRWPAAVSVFFGIKGGSALLLAAVGIWATIAFGDPGSAFLPAICGLGFGYMLPDRVLERIAGYRTRQLRRALPSALDLMVLAVEAGQGLDAAILEASRGLRVAHPELASELTQLSLELRANTTREEALRNLIARSRDSEIKKFALVLIDTDRFGTTLGPTLRTHARYLRTRFRQAAQEKARKVAVKLIFPVFFLIFPSVILVTLGPASILLFTQLKNILGP